MEQEQNRRFGVSLTEDEYVLAQQVLLKATSPFSLIARCLSPFLLGWILLSSMLENGIGTDIQQAISLLLLVIVQVVAIVWIPRVEKQRHRERYRAALLNGYSFDGVVEITEDAVTKCTVNGKTEIPFSACPLFVESRDVMIFCNPNGKHILLPSTYLTEDDAEFLRQAVLKHIPPNRQKWLKKLEPRAGERLPLPSLEAADEPELYALRFQYTPKELRAFMLEVTVDGVVKQLPTKALVLLFVLTLLIAMDSLFLIPVAAVVMLGWVLLPLVVSPFQVNRAITNTNGAVLTVTVAMTEHAMYIVTQNGKEQRKSRLLWTYVTRAVLRDDSVEFYTPDKILSIPRRCIDDLDELERVVDTYVT